MTVFTPNSSLEAMDIYVYIVVALQAGLATVTVGHKLCVQCHRRYIRSDDAVRYSRVGVGDSACSCARVLVCVILSVCAFPALFQREDSWLFCSPEEQKEEKEEKEEEKEKKEGKEEKDEKEGKEEKEEKEKKEKDEKEEEKEEKEEEEEEEKEIEKNEQQSSFCSCEARIHLKAFPLTLSTKAPLELFKV
ncbi:hypothetical protein LSTR_LSTR014023 [Laodelphax striatellus]|uniref:Uncharacterized protein n=1 Tax=Laodelphax striatellus TaxID=195883 RepID=A0A482WID6_LAOST|nr:hypothetical protein LSTR_LSTR014023 [Laodelphax striatellus]